MQSYFRIFDDFLEDFDSLREHATQLDFTGVINPEDGVLYPDVSTDVPKEVIEEITKKLSIREVHRCFFRLTTENTKGAPHQAHTDTAMGPRSLMLYMQDGPGGTSLVAHKETGLRTDPFNQWARATWQRDTKRPEAWEIYDLAPMKANRAAVFNSRLMHRAEPIGGFGSTPADGRLVLTMFYTPQETSWLS